jgi:hypothetical protein
MTAPDFRIRNRAELVDALSVAAQGRHTPPASNARLSAGAVSAPAAQS